MAASKTCKNTGCRNKFKPSGRQIYCSKPCKRNAEWKRSKKETIDTEEKVITSTSRGNDYPEFVQKYAVKLESKKLTHQQVADAMNISRSVVTKMLAAYVEDKENYESQKDWEIAEDTVKSLQDFKDFRDRYFKTETGELYETAEFHENWINNIVDAIENGKQQMILSPPRHGKTDLLTHFAVWQICKNPNIRIMWVGGNEDIEQNRSHYSHNYTNNMQMYKLCYNYL